MNIKTFFIDVGGVLVRTESIKKRLVWEQKLGLEPLQLTKELFKVQPAKEATIGLVSADKIWKNVAEKYSLDDYALQKFKFDFFAGEIINKEFYDFVRKLHKNYKIAILSNAWDEVREVYTNTYHLDKITDRMIISAEEGMRKPHKKFYRLALKLMDTTPNESVYVDDGIDNIRSAKGLGFNTVLFKTTEQAIEAINAYLQM